MFRRVALVGARSVGLGFCGPPTPAPEPEDPPAEECLPQPLGSPNNFSSNPESETWTVETSPGCEDPTTAG